MANKKKGRSKGGAKARAGGGKVAVKVIAVILAVLAIAYVIISLVLGGQWDPTKWRKRGGAGNDMETVAGLTIEPDKVTFGVISLEARAATLSDDIEADETEEEEKEYYILTASTPEYEGEVTWSLKFLYTPTAEKSGYWAERPTAVSNYLELTSVDERSVKVTCLKAFGTPISVIAKRVDTGETATCRCDYRAAYIDENIFSIGDYIMIDSDKNVRRDYGAIDISLTSRELDCHWGNYTSGTRGISTLSRDFEFEIRVNEEWQKLFGLTSYNFKTYKNYMQNEEGTDITYISNFFDEEWINTAIGASTSEEKVNERNAFLRTLYTHAVSTSEVEAEMPDFYSKLQGVDKGTLFYADMLPAYKLVIPFVNSSHETEYRNYDIYLDFSAIAELNLGTGIEMVPDNLEFGNNS